MCILFKFSQVILTNQYFSKLFRHGDRTPQGGEVYPLDPYRSKYGPEGQLTSVIYLNIDCQDAQLEIFFNF